MYPIISLTLYTFSSSCTLFYLSSPGCYPRCPKDKPVYNEETKECVPEDQCWCYINGTHVPPGSEIPTEENCTKWYKKNENICSNSGKNLCMLSPSFTLLGLKQIEMQLQLKSWYFSHLSIQIRGTMLFIPVET